MATNPEGEPVYVDSSLLVALLARDDSQHDAARRWQRSNRSPVVTSVIAAVEVHRTLIRRNVHASLRRAGWRYVARVHQVEVTVSIREAAVQVRPAGTRSLDALHIATALAADVRWFVSFDIRQLVAAEEMGLAVLAPA